MLRTLLTDEQWSRIVEVLLETGVYRFAFEGEDGEDAFVDAAERLAAEARVAQPFEVFGGSVWQRPGKIGKKALLLPDINRLVD